MTQGVFINGSRPKTKKALKEQIDGINVFLDHGGDPESPTSAKDPYSVVIEATSLFGNEFDGSLAEARRQSPPQNGPFYIVGPDPYNSRKWYASLEYDTSKHKWILK